VNKAKGGFSLKQENYNKELEKEKEKLNRLADKALESGIPLTQDEAFMAQNRKVDELIVKIQMEKERHEINNGNDKSSNPIALRNEALFLFGGD